MPVSTARLAPAKVNLFLHVAPVDRDGFHPLSSLMVFADIGDRVALETAPPGELSLEVEGPFAAELAGTPPDDNLVLRAVRRLWAATGSADAGARLRLAKRLPVAAGLGGGSSDAGAALVLARDALVRARADAPDDAGLERIAAELGSDGPACLRARPVLGVGRGEVLRPAPALPPLHAVLVNPRVACPTGAVYRAYDAGPTADADPPALPPAFADLAALLPVLADARNDLEAPAARLVPAVAETLDAVRGAPECRLGRLSGSGATVFALVDDAAAAASLAARMARAHPAWWTAPCRLGAPALDIPEADGV